MIPVISADNAIDTSEAPPIKAHKLTDVGAGSRRIIANGNVVRHDCVIFFLTTALGVHKLVQVYFCQ
jgi:hypothetical protein